MHARDRICRRTGWARARLRPVPWARLALVTALFVPWAGFEPEGADLSPAHADTRSSQLVGRASVIDGDTIQIHGERIRLDGIDAPESAQTCRDGSGRSYRCGAMVAENVDRFLRASPPTRCVFVDRDQYGRFVGDCTRADGTHVQAALVRNGWAMDFPRHSGGAYAAEEAAARREKLGIWAGTVMAPWEWRASQRQSSWPARQMRPGETGAPGNCRIKGNISSKGHRIYHVPGQEDYARTRINEARGERWFCSEGEARSAGWRRARR